MARRVIGFYTDEKGRRRPITARKRKGRRSGTVFFPAESKKYSEIIRIDTPEAARLSVKQLMDEFEKAKTRNKKRRIKRYAVLAATRARIISQNPKVSPSQRREAAEVAEIYKRAYERMKL